jgi:hypothetical protein
MDEIILKFMQTGKLGFLQLGMQLNHIKENLSDLDENLLRKTKNIHVFDYGNLSLFFQNKKLTAITIDFRRTPVSLPTSVYSEYFIRDFPKTFESFVDFLSNQKINHEIVYNEDGFLQLKLKDDVFAKFIDGKTSSIKAINEDMM